MKYEVEILKPKIGNAGQKEYGSFMSWRW